MASKPAAQKQASGQQPAPPANRKKILNNQQVLT